MPKKKRKYTFIKGKLMSYPSGSLMHKMEKEEKEIWKNRKKKSLVC